MNVSLKAQKGNSAIQTDKSLSISILSNKSVLIEEFFSQTSFEGWVPSLKLGYQAKSDKLFQSLQVDFGAGKQTLKSNSDFTLNQKSFLIDYTRLYALNPVYKKLDVWLGGNLASLYNSRRYKGFINTDQSFEWLTSLSVAGNLRFLINENNDLRFYIEDRVRIPFLSLLYQPAYGAEQTTGEINGHQSVSSFFKSSRMVSFNKYFQVDNSFSITKELSPSIAISFVYEFQLLRINAERSVRKMNHDLGLSFALQL